jgi:genome maintenance exonuclease 1
MFELDLVNLEELNSKTLNGRRFYDTPDGLSYPSVTTVVGILSKDDIQAWRMRVGEKKADAITKAAITRGNEVHKLAEYYVKNELKQQQSLFDQKKTTPQLMFERLSKVLDQKLGVIKAVEAPLYSDKLKVGGRVDLIAEWDGVPSIIDFKTSSKPKRDNWIKGYYLQSSAYAAMYEERTGIAINQIVIAIAVENLEVQVFIKKPSDYIQEFINLRKSYDIIYPGD